MIVDKTFFKGLIAIDGINSQTTASFAVMSRLQEFIDVYEDEYLDLLLGKDKESFVSAVQSEELDGRWGEVLAMLKKDISPIACYIFFHFVRGTQYTVTGTGVNTEGKSCYNVCADAWNEMVKNNKKMKAVLLPGMADELIRPIIW